MTRKTKRISFTQFLTDIGFDGIEVAASKNDPALIRAFSYESFDTAEVRRTLGKAKAHKPGLFVFVGRGKDGEGRTFLKGMRVDTERKRILLGNGKKAVQALLRSVEKG